MKKKIENEVARKFNNRRHLEVVVSDLTYVKVNDTWNYVCILLNLANREIIGYSAGKNKNASLVYDVFMKVEGNLKDIEIFHTDRGNEFKNKLIEDVLETFESNVKFMVASSSEGSGQSMLPFSSRLKCTQNPLSSQTKSLMRFLRWLQNANMTFSLGSNWKLCWTISQRPLTLFLISVLPQAR